MILIIDNYDSFTYNLVHLVGMHTEDVRVERNDAITVNEIDQLNPSGILISPGPGRPADAGITCEIVKCLSDRIPILGVCLGHQAIGEVFGGVITNAPKLMHGKTSEINHDGKTIFKDLPAQFVATRYHSLAIKPDTFPEELEVSARTADGTIMALRHPSLPIEGIQFHPESILTKAGPRLIANWLEQYTNVTPRTEVGA